MFIVKLIRKMGDLTPTTSTGNRDSFIGSIDQGTTSTRFLIFNRDGEVVASHQVEFKQIYPQSG
jgi:glycerol kinase